MTLGQAIAGHCCTVGELVVDRAHDVRVQTCESSAVIGADQERAVALSVLELAGGVVDLASPRIGADAVVHHRGDELGHEALEEAVEPLLGLNSLRDCELFGLHPLALFGSRDGGVEHFERIGHDSSF